MPSTSSPQERTSLSIGEAQAHTGSVLSRSIATRWLLLLAFGLFFLVGAALAWPSLKYPMIYDDLHLIHSFSPQELGQVWHSPWDIDGIETPGFRPLTPLFNHVRFVLFGENVVAQRLFLIFLYALYLTMFTWVARQCGLPWHAAVLACLLCLVAKYSTFHYVWLADGIHLFQGVLCAGAVATLILALRSGRWWWAISLLLLICGLLVREDSLAIVPALIAIGLFFARSRQSRSRRRMLALYSYIVAAACMCATFLIYRASILASTAPSHINVVGWLFHATLAFSPPGIHSFDMASGLSSTLWSILFLALLGGWVVYRRRVGWQLPILWMLCAILASAPGLIMARSNLLLIPITFAGLFIMALLSQLIAVAGWWRFVGATMLICGLAGGSYASLITAQSFHPSSITALKWNSEMLYAESTRTATIPTERRVAVATQLALYGIQSAADAKARIAALADEAKQAQRFAPTTDGRPFLPKQLGFLEP